MCARRGTDRGAVIISDRTVFPNANLAHGWTAFRRVPLKGRARAHLKLRHRTIPFATQTPSPLRPPDPYRPQPTARKSIVVVVVGRLSRPLYTNIYTWHERFTDVDIFRSNNTAQRNASV